MFKLRNLPFDKAKHSFLSEETFNYHYAKHHQAYVNKLNELIANTENEKKDLYDIILSAKGGLFNQAAQVYNHDFYWDCIAKKSEISEDFKKVLAENFSDFKAEFLAAAAGNFGSGWTWLVYNPKNSKLEILSTSNAQTPLTEGLVPLLVVDVWEHAYYIDDRNARPAYLEKFYENINWDFVEECYEWAKKEGMNSVKFWINEIHGQNSCCGNSCGCK